MHRIDSLFVLAALLVVASCNSLTALPRADPNSTLIVSVAIRNRNMDQIYAAVDRASDPTGPFYGQFLTFEDVVELTSNLESSKVVLSYLRLKEEVKIISVSFDKLWV